MGKIVLLLGKIILVLAIIYYLPLRNIIVLIKSNMGNFMKKIIYILFLCIASVPLFAQETTVSGTVTEAVTREPLPGVAVQVKGVTTGTLTDIDGKYSIKASEGETLIFSQVGLQKQEVVVTSSIIDVVMQEDIISLDQVVVIGYGAVKKSHLSGAVNSLSSKELNADMFTSAASALQGKIPGVMVSSSTGAPGDGMNITIRGVTSMSDNTPLYVIDGVISDFGLVNPSDIQSIEVLKDASAAAIYGSRAASGVILVTTKTGRIDSPTKLSMNVSTGLSMLPKKIQVMDGNEYSRFARYYGLPADGYGGGDKGYLESGGEFMGEGTDWQDVMYRTAMTYNANATLSGGSKSATYSTSLGYLDKEGIMQESSHSSFNIRVKTDYAMFNNRVKIGQTLIVKSSRNKGYTNNDTTFEILQYPSITPVYDSTNPYGWGTTEIIPLQNPYAQTQFMDVTSRNTNVFLNAYAEAEIITGLKYKFNLGVIRNNSNGRTHTGKYDLGIAGRNEEVKLSESSGNTNNWLQEHTLNYNKDIGLHNLNVLLGYSSQKDRVRSQNSNGIGIPDGVETIPGTTSGGSTTSTSRSEYAMISMFGRLMYSYDNRYLLSASIRRDGSSRFAKGHRFGWFPSVSAGWNIHKESFAAPLKDTFDQLKLRVSYGVLGNSNIGNYPTQSTVSTDLNAMHGKDLWVGSMPGVSAVSPPNLKWEETKTANVGIDITTLNGKLDFTADLFHKKTANFLLSIPIAPSAGISGDRTQNAGAVVNKGVELTINYRNAIGDFSYYAGVNFSALKNKVTDVIVDGMQTDRQIIGYTANQNASAGISRFGRGHSMTYFYLLESQGLFQSQAEIDAYVDKNGKKIQPNAKPGDVKYLDYNGDGTIDANDLHDVGTPFPDFDFGIRLGGEWKGIDFNMFWDGMVGNKVFNAPRYRIESGNFQGNYSYRLANSWREDNRDTDIPRFSKVDGQMNRIAYSDRWLEDGSFLRLKSFDVGYSLPASLVNKMKLEKLRVYTSLENMFIITKYKGYTPDIGESANTESNYRTLSKGVDSGRYPVPRTISFGIQIGF